MANAALWCDRYRPPNLAKLDYHRLQADHLKKLIHSNEFPHLFFYGPSGSGKKTRCYCVLKELFGGSVEKLRLNHEQFTTPSNRKLDMTIVVSNYHIEVNPSAVGIQDRVVIQELIKNLATSGKVKQLETRLNSDLVLI